MSEENNSAKISEAESTSDETKKLSEDARGLGPRQVGPIMIGVVDMIVGDGGVEVPSFLATKNEILQLVRYWAKEIIDSDFVFFLYGATGSSEWRTREFANRPLNTISKLIGEEEVTKAFRQTEQAIAKEVGPEAWRIFTKGTKEEQERFQQEVQERLARDTEEGRK
jgi:hypothetical protein